jgi:hypothetical protein
MYLCFRRRHFLRDEQVKYGRLGFQVVLSFAVFWMLVFLGGCGKGGFEGYSNSWLVPSDISSVYVKMFDSTGFRRGHEYTLTDAICKRIEAETPYKIVSNIDSAETVLSGTVGISAGVIAGERYTGRPVEMEALATVTVSWKNLKTGEVLINNEQVSASSTYSTQLGQDVSYASDAAVNRAAEKVVELMERRL